MRIWDVSPGLQSQPIPDPAAQLTSARVIEQARAILKGRARHPRLDGIKGVEALDGNELLQKDEVLLYNNMDFNA